MYAPVQKTSAVQLVRQWMSQFTVQQVPDGLSFIVPTAVQETISKNLRLPEALEQWLVDLRLLRHIPLSYMVPDAALLPPESIRFFNVDYTWIDRVIDGVFASANTGTVDSTFTYTILGLIRKHIDSVISQRALDAGDASNWKHGSKPMTGMLIRSQIARRWPDMVVEAFHDAAGTKVAGLLRAEPVSRDIYIALFAGQPARLHIREPFVGVRFGVEKSGAVYRVDKRGTNGEDLTGHHTVLVNAEKKINVGDLATKVGGTSRMVALHLEQRPYQQVFLNTTKEEQGSRAPTLGRTLKLKNGRVMRMDKYVSRYQQYLEVEKP